MSFHFLEIRLKLVDELNNSFTSNEHFICVLVLIWIEGSKNLHIESKDNETTVSH